MGNNTGRIIIPQNIEKKLELAAKILAKHNADGDASKLNILPDFDWSKMGTIIETAKTKHVEAEKWKSKMEETYRDRDLLLPAIKSSLIHSRNLLKALYPDNPKRLGEYGMEVDDTPRVRKMKNVKANIKTAEGEPGIQD